MSVKKIATNRDFIRWVGVLGGFGLIAWGVFSPVKTSIGETKLDNTLMIFGFIFAISGLLGAQILKVIQAKLTGGK